MALLVVNESEFYCNSTQAISRNTLNDDEIKIIYK